MLRRDCVSYYDVVGICNKTQVTTEDVFCTNPIVSSIVKVLNTITNYEWGIGEIIVACRIFNFYELNPKPFYYSDLESYFCFSGNSTEGILLKRVFERLHLLGYFANLTDTDVYWCPKNWHFDVKEAATDEKFSKIADELIIALTSCDRRAPSKLSGFTNFNYTVPLVKIDNLQNENELSK